MGYGDLLTDPYQYELSNGTTGLLMGAKTGFQVEAVNGLFDLPDIIDSDTNIPFDDGMIPGLDYIGKRKITMKLNLLGDESFLDLPDRRTDIEDKLNQMRRWFQTSAVDLGLAYRRPGTVDQFLWVRPKRRAIPSDADVALGLAVATVELHAANPYVYSLATYTSTIAIATNGTQGSATVVPAGESVSRRVQITIPGPVTTPLIISNSADNNWAIRLNISASAGSTIVIDLYNKTVTLNGVQQWVAPRTDNQWWRLIPQTNNTITIVRGAAAAAINATLTWRDAWR